MAVNIDTARLDRPADLPEGERHHRPRALRRPSADVLQALKRQGGLLGLPTTLLIDRNGCELGRMAGPAEWASPDGQAVIRALKG